MADNNTNDAMVEMYLFETFQLLEQLEQIILSSDVNQCFSKENINEIFRIMHTIKGSSAMMMYNEISVLSHSLEDLFSYIREIETDQYDFSSLNDLVLECIDFIKIELEKIRNKDDVDGDATELVDKVKTFLSELKNNGNIGSGRENKKENVNIFKAVLYFEESCEMENIRAYLIVHRLKKISRDFYYFPQNITDDNSVETIRSDGFQIFIKTYKTDKELYDFLMETLFIKELNITTIDEDLFLSQQNISSAELTRMLSVSGDDLNLNDNRGNVNKKQRIDRTESLSMMSSQNIISVSVDKVDKLMDLVGEMVIAEAMVLQNPDLEGLELNNFNKAGAQLSKITSEIQDMVMSIRMVPLSATFHRMHRIVRDMCRKLNKDIRLEIIGEETEVDKNIIEHITDPLMHLVRNSVDHGIESPNERIMLGKPKNGTITLEAKNVGSDVHIIIKDDGRGLDKNKILKKARENNLISANEENISDTDIYRLILLPGFSTNDNVTEFSGRGVGMDVVAKNIESIGGSILIDSIENHGTQIILKIPLTLAIIDGMNLQVGKSIYTIPTFSIKESFRPKEESIIIDPDGNEMIMVRGQCYPILRLHQYFGIKTEIENLADGIIIMVSQDDKTICIFADRLLGQQQIVVKSLPEYIKRYFKLQSISGCTLLGDGSISLIIDTANILNTR